MQGYALSLNEFSNVSLNFLFIKNFWALIARIRSLPWVNYHMFLQISTIWESFGTMIAWVWFLPWMDSQMFFKLWFSETALEHWLQGYGFSPQWILKWIAKLPSCEKSFSAFFALVWLTKKSKQSSIPPLVENNEVVNSNNEKVTIFNNFFAEKASLPSFEEEAPELDKMEDIPDLNVINTSPFEVSACIKKLKKSHHLMGRTLQSLELIQVKVHCCKNCSKKRCSCLFVK